MGSPQTGVAVTFSGSHNPPGGVRRLVTDLLTRAGYDGQVRLVHAGSDRSKPNQPRVLVKPPTANDQYGVRIAVCPTGRGPVHVYCVPLRKGLPIDAERRRCVQCATDLHEVLTTQAQSLS